MDLSCPLGTCDVSKCHSLCLSVCLEGELVCVQGTNTDTENQGPEFWCLTRLRHDLKTWRWRDKTGQADLYSDLSTEEGPLSPPSKRLCLCVCSHVQKCQLMAATQTTNLPSGEWQLNVLLTWPAHLITLCPTRPPTVNISGFTLSECEVSVQVLFS